MPKSEFLMKVSPRQRLTVVLALATLVSAFGSSFQYGYNVAVINSPAPVTMADMCRRRFLIVFSQIGAE